MLNEDTGADRNLRVPALLVLGYLRPTNLARILSIAESSGISSIYISIDAPKVLTQQTSAIHDDVVRISKEYAQKSGLDVRVMVRNQNVGCASAVLSSCDWFFSNEEWGVVLEDDCIPSPDFFKFVQDSLLHIESDNDIWMVCGTQFAPPELCDVWQKSTYALTWGWATTRDRWHDMTFALRLRESNLERGSNANLAECCYWNAGAKRAFAGFSDAWDTPLLQRMKINNKYALLPRQALVTNIGNDRFAVHTHGDSIGLNQSLGRYQRTSNPPQTNEAMDNWLRDHFYKIRSRHILTTKFTSLLDFLAVKSQKNRTLVQGWDDAKL